MDLEQFLAAYGTLFGKGWRTYWGVVKRKIKPIWLTPAPNIVLRTENYRRVWIFCPLSAVCADRGGPIVHCGVSIVTRRFLGIESDLAHHILNEGDGISEGLIRTKLIDLSVFDTYHKPMTLRHMP